MNSSKNIYVIRFRSLLCSFTIVIVLHILFLFYIKLNGYSRLQNFEGIIIRKEMTSDHLAPIVVILKNNHEYRHCIVNKKMLNKIDSGDFIIKRKWTDKYILIKKNNDTIIFKP